MYLFYVQEPLFLIKEPVVGARRGLSYRPRLCSATTAHASSSSGPCVRLMPPANGVLTADTLFAAFSFPLLKQLGAFSKEVERPSLIRLLSDRDQKRTLSLPGMPIRLGAGKPGDPSLETQLDGASLRRHPRIALLNPFGFALGDTIVALSTIREFQRRLEQRVGAIQLDVLQHPDNVETEELYLQSGLVRAVYHLPVPLSFLAQYDAYVDFSSDIVSRRLCWVDDMLEMLGIDHTSVPAQRKRNSLTIQPSAVGSLAARIARLRSRASPIVLFHGSASEGIRSMPESLMRTFLEEILERTDWIVVSVHPVPVRHSRVLDWSSLSTSFQRFAYVISQMDAFLCVDTCVYHVADAFDVPGVVLFTTVPPHLRTPRYPGVHGILLGGETNKLAGPQRAQVDEPAYVGSLWAELDVGGVVRSLQDVVAVRRGSSPDVAVMANCR